MIIDESPNLEIFGVYDRGVPNKERIVLHVNRVTNLAEYFVVLGIRAPLSANLVLPIEDHSLWLGSTYIEVPSWIFIFTGYGKAATSQETHTGQPVHTLYWKKPQVVLTHNDIVPALLHVDSVQIGNKPNKSVADILKPQDNPRMSDFSQLLKQLGENKLP